MIVPIEDTPVAQRLIKRPNFEILWHAFLRASSERSVKVILRRVEKTIGYPLEQTRYERYWKDPSLFNTHFSCSLTTDDIVQATFETLQIAQQVHSRWNVVGPYEKDNDRWEFHGDADQCRFTGVTLLSFITRNFDTRESGQELLEDEPANTRDRGSDQ